MSKPIRKSLISKIHNGLAKRDKQACELIDIIYDGESTIKKLEAVSLVSKKIVGIFDTDGELVIGDPMADLLISVCSDYYGYKLANRDRELSRGDIKRESIYNIANAVGIALISRRQLIKSETLADALKVVVDDLTAFESQVAA